MSYASAESGKYDASEGFPVIGDTFGGAGFQRMMRTAVAEPGAIRETIEAHEEVLFYADLSDDLRAVLEANLRHARALLAEGASA